MASLSGAEFVGIIEQMDAFVRFVDLRSFQLSNKSRKQHLVEIHHSSVIESFMAGLYVCDWWG
jgi:hypothetical protein